MAQKQITTMEVKKNNRNRIFRYICKNDCVSNPDISYELKMSLPTVTQITKELIEQGIVKETGVLQSTGGRRAKALSAAADFRVAVGLDVTRNHIGLILINLAGEVLKYDRIPQAYENSEKYYREVNRKLEEFLDKCGAVRERILGIGVSFPGIVDLQKEEIAYSHILGVKEIPFAAVCSFFSYPCYFFNDANAGACAEGIQSGDTKRFFYLSLSNTVGGAIFSRGELEQGSDFRCGEVGHMTIVPDGLPCYCGKKGCMDAYCSAKGLSVLADDRLESFFSRLHQGDRDIEEVWDRYTTYLAIAVNNIHMILDCPVILGGYVGSFLEEYVQGIRDKVLRRNTFAEDGSFIKVCSYKVEAAAMGAALKVMENFIEQI